MEEYRSANSELRLQCKNQKSSIAVFKETFIYYSQRAGWKSGMGFDCENSGFKKDADSLAFGEKTGPK